MDATERPSLPSGPPRRLRYDWSLDQRLSLTVDEAAFTLGVSRSFLEEAITAGEINVAHRGRRILVPVSALKRFLEALTVSSGSRVRTVAQLVVEKGSGTSPKGTRTRKGTDSTPGSERPR